jgi:hypothetical protein
VQGQRVAVVCYGDGEGGRLENATHMVMLDSRGYPVDRVQLPQFSGRIPASPASLTSISEDTRKGEDSDKIVKFLSKHWPHLIVVGTASPECKQLMSDLEKIIDVDFSQVQLTYPVVFLSGRTVRSEHKKDIFVVCRFSALFVLFQCVHE